MIRRGLAVGVLTACASAPTPKTAATAPAKPQPRDEPYLTEFGRTLVAPSDLWVVGVVRSISKIPGGTAVATVRVQDGPDATQSVAAPIGALEASDAPVLLFLGPKERLGFVRPLVAVCRGDAELLSTLSDLARRVKSIALLPDAASREAATRELLLEQLADPRAAARNEALQECSRLVARPAPFFREEDARTTEILAGRSTDPARAAALRDLAERMRARLP